MFSLSTRRMTWVGKPMVVAMIWKDSKAWQIPLKLTYKMLVQGEYTTPII